MKKNKIERITIYAAWVTIISAICLIIYFFFLMYWPAKIVDIHSPSHVTTPVIERGGLLEYDVEVCNYVDARVTISRRLSNEIVYSLPSITDYVEKGCKVTHRALTIPAEIPAGKYKLTVCADYEINRIRKVSVTWETEEFEIVD